MINIRKLETELWESADLLRAGSKLTSNQYCMPVLGLIFLRYAYSRFKLVEAEILKDRPVRNGRVLPVEASDFTSRSALYLPRDAQYAYLLNLPENIADADLKNHNGEPMNSLGEVVNNAMELVEAQSEQLTGVLPKTYTMFSDELLAELLRIFNNSALDDVGGDIIGQIYEYFLNKFAKNIAQDDGVFFTPKSLVKMIVNVLEPTQGVLLDPACGSGGMFVQTGDFVEQTGMLANNTMTFYGQEKVEYNAQLCLMNLAVHGLTGVIKSGDEANTFYHDAHNLAGGCDYVMANPPFNVDEVVFDKVKDDARFNTYGVPRNKSKSTKKDSDKKETVPNANYLWIGYFATALNETGKAALVMANSASDAGGSEYEIRKRLIEEGVISQMVTLPSNMFSSVTLPATLWFFDKQKCHTDKKDEILFIDARNVFTQVDRAHRKFSDEQIKNLGIITKLYNGDEQAFVNLIEEYKANLEKAPEVSDDKEIMPKSYWQAQIDWLTERFPEGKYQDVIGLCKAAKLDGEDGIIDQDYSLNAGRYVGVVIEDDGLTAEEFKAEMLSLNSEFEKLNKEAHSLEKQISENLMGLLGK